MAKLEKVHLVIGFTALAFFSGTGMWLHRHDPQMDALSMAPRLLLRSGHIYLLFSGLLNVVAGLTVEGRRMGLVRFFGSLLLLLSPVLLAIGFCLESTGSLLERPLTQVAVTMTVGAVLLLFIAFVLASRKGMSHADR